MILKETISRVLGGRDDSLFPLSSLLHQIILGVFLSKGKKKKTQVTHWEKTLHLFKLIVR